MFCPTASSQEADATLRAVNTLHVEEVCEVFSRLCDAVVAALHKQAEEIQSRACAGKCRRKTSNSPRCSPCIFASSTYLVATHAGGTTPEAGSARIETRS